MKNTWSFFTNLDHDGGFPHGFLTETQVSQFFGLSLLPRLSSLVDSSLSHSKHLYISGNAALQESFSCLNKFAGAFFVWLSTGANSYMIHRLSSNTCGSNSRGYGSQIKHVTSCIRNLAGLHFSHLKEEHGVQLLLARIANSAVGRLWKEIERDHACHILSLAAAIIPPFDNISSKVLAESITLGNKAESINGSMDRLHRENSCPGCANLAISNISWTGDAVEPKTGIKFPASLEDISNFTTEVLVGTGSRSMRIITFKSLKVYAFGLYIHPDSVCEKLGPKYASVPIGELTNRSDFFEDLLREDIHMTVRLVVNCNGLKINNVRDAFEKSLRVRLQKMNPDTDYHCLRTFGSYFTQDIPIPMGTTINFRQTADGQLITEIGGKHMGAVHSKDLCRAFFDMYIGDVPVSMQAKQEIAQNVAVMISRC
ncbi:fatty-acid-binding protein 2 [Typha latifolia]|uniref:fatty-acid-binding protein 2 n=1 Tax=Typha latifolia TaxID=4733 RepID=UPI003C2CD660